MPIARVRGRVAQLERRLEVERDPKIRDSIAAQIAAFRPR